MNDSKIVLLINDSARAIRAQYDNETCATTFKTMDQTIKVGDIVAVETDTRYGVTGVKVTEVDFDVNFDSSETVKWVIQKINTEAFEELLEQEKAAIAAVHSAERRRKRDELKASMFADHEESLAKLALAQTEEVVAED